MLIEYDLGKSLPENAKIHYERAKKLKKKIPGIQKAILESEKKLKNADTENPVDRKRIKKKVKRRWFEKYRWFRSSDGYLVIGGRDATTNDMLVKKHMQPSDRVFHANIQGAPFFLVKNEEGAEIPEDTIKQAASAAASYSKAWARGMGSVDVYEVDPEQVSKTPPSGEYLPKGAFMIYGEKRWHRNVPLEVALGFAQDRVVGGPVDAVKSKTEEYVRVLVGDKKQGTLAKMIKSRIKQAELDEIQRFLPPGGGDIV